MEETPKTYQLKRHRVVEESVDGRIMRVLEGRASSICELLHRAAARHPDREGFVDATHRWTFGRFAANASRLATGLRTELSLQKGDRVAMLMQTGVPYVLSLFAAAEAGAVSVPLNSRFTVEELAYEVENSESRVLLVDEAFAETVRENRRSFGSVEHVVVNGKGGPPGFRSLEELFPTGEGKRLPPVPLRGDDLLMILYTSGTTGVPKGAMLTHRGAVHAAMLIEDVFDPVPEDRMLNVLPMFHAAGTIMSAFSSVCMGIPCVYMPRFKTEAVLDTIQRERISIMVHVPTVYWLMANCPDLDRYDLSSLRAAIVGGAPKSREAFEQIMEKLPKVRFADTFGMTETHSMDFVLTHEELQTHMETVGRPVPVVEVRVADNAGNPLPAGEAGEIMLSGPKIMKGYWKNPEATKECLIGGWLRTGDVGSMDAEGYVTILDRIKDMINRGGENIYSVEVENALRRHPAVDEAAVVGVPDEVFGEEVKAYVSLKPSTDPTVEELREHCRAVLADYKVPRYLEFVTDFPRNPTGKILKNRLRRQA
ncbi:MAG: class I adenylate-forming enzyme family protein [Desulfobacteraceae bacterium]